MNDVTETVDFRLYLQEVLIRKCKNNPKYSLRAFAKALDIDFSALSKILRGKRKLGKRNITRLGLKLGLDPAELNKFIEKETRASSRADASGTDAGGSHARGRRASGSVRVGGASTAQDRDDYHRISVDAFKIIADWSHYAILELIRVDGFRPQPQWIAKVLGISIHEVNTAIDRLVRLGFLRIDESGAWHDLSGGKTTAISDHFTSNAFRLHQTQVLQKALAALDEVSLERRSQTSMTMAIDTARLPEAKEIITRFRRDLARFLSRGERRDEVYNLSISLYPLTQIGQPTAREQKPLAAAAQSTSSPTGSSDASAAVNGAIPAPAYQPFEGNPS